MTSRGGSEDGVIATQLAVLMPALLFLIMLAVQYGLWAHATQLADAAADAAATAASLATGTADDGQQAAADLLDQTGNLSELVIVVDRGPTEATATVSGAAPNVVPGLRWHVSARAAAPLEVFVPQGDR